ncbi:MAG: ADP-ribosylglycohydrolase family protein [Saprospiraceae bacterium]
MKSNKVIDALFGVAVGDAVGVPFEFNSREAMKLSPAEGMVGYGTYDQPEGTWSDDSSLTFCLAESLVLGYDLVDISKRFINWKNEAYWSARGELFDIGLTTSKAISRLQEIIAENDLGELKMQKFYGNEYDNGNGSLMRIIPLLFYIKGKEVKEQFDIVWEVSALTHRHIRAAMSCFIYLKLAEKLLMGINKEIAYSEMRAEIMQFWDEMEFATIERKHFERVIQNDIRKTKIDDLKSGGYVIEVLESSIWFFLEKNNYEETILSIINIGHDTDTSAAIAGGLAGIYYGLKGIPEYWVASTARMEDIITLGNKLNEKCLVMR